MERYCRFEPTQKMRTRTRLLPMVLFSVFTVGCDNGRSITYPVVGTVFLADGTPLAGGLLAFRLEGNDDTPTAKAEIQADGTFQLSTYAEGDGALAGKHRVRVRPADLMRSGALEAKFGRRRSRESNEGLQIDPRYYDFHTSGLTYTVSNEGSENHFEIRLESQQ